MDGLDLTPWMVPAVAELGTKEIVDGRANPRIKEYFGATGFKAGDAQDAWCSAFANWCMAQAGVRGTRSAAARSWLRWGRELETPVPGCIVVFSRPPNPSSGHVAFYQSETPAHVYVLGGNQNQKVCRKYYPRARVLSYRMPTLDQP